MSFIIMMILVFSITFIFLNHPMTMGFTLLLQTISISLISSLLNLNFWFSYILFLIMIGGMLVLFIYMTSIASNEMFTFSNKIMFLILIPISLYFMTFFIDNFFFSLNASYMENMFFLDKPNLSMNKFFNYPSIMIFFMMIIYLFITLVAIVKITNMNFGPLRSKIN